MSLKLTRVVLVLFLITTLLLISHWRLDSELSKQKDTIRVMGGDYNTLETDMKMRDSNTSTLINIIIDATTDLQLKAQLKRLDPKNIDSKNK